MWYCEEFRHGAWHPVTYANRPKVRDERIVTGAGPRIRALREVPASLEKLTLDQMREVLGPDGKFTTGQNREAKQ